MGVGRPDYNQKIVPVAEVIGDDEESFSLFGLSNINPGATVEILSYPVGLTFDLYIKQLIVSTNNPVANFLSILSENKVNVYSYFVTDIIINGSGASSVICHAGYSLVIQVTNNYDYVAPFYYSLSGYKRLIN
jgi:hypothetical protein